MNRSKNEHATLENAYLKISRELLEYVLAESDMENVVCSPYSFYILLALALNAFGGNTQEEVLEVLAPGNHVKSFNRNMKRLQSDFAKTVKDCKFISSNGICVEDGLYKNILSAFKKLASSLYDATFFPAGEDMVQKVNAWVNQKTDGMIPYFLNEVPAQFKVCLMNAIAFDAKWQNPYDEEDICKAGKFSNVDGTVSKVPFMSSTETDYIEDDYFTGFLKDYKGGKYALMALLPKEENTAELLAKGVAQIDFSKYYRERNTAYEVYARMPEFECEGGMELTAFCNKLGLNFMFTPTADFSGMTDQENLMVDSVFQKAIIKVNRAGTKAAAVTGMLCVTGCMPDLNNTKRVNLNRPFVYAIINKEYDGLPVFAGVVNRL